MSTLYKTYLNHVMTGNAGPDLGSGGDTIKAALVDTGTYTLDADNHDFFDDLSGVVATATLSNQSVAANVFDADDTTFSGVSGATVEAVVIYQDTGVAGTSRLIAYIDGLTLTPDGNDVTATWDAAGIFTIGAS